MLNWLRNKFYKEEEPEVVTSALEKEPDISEPVYAIAKALEERPHTFSVHEDCLFKHCLKVVDRYTSIKFRGFARSTVGYVETREAPFGFKWDETYFIITSFNLTYDEEQFLGKAFHDWLDEKKERINKKKRNRVKRKYNV